MLLTSWDWKGGQLFPFQKVHSTELLGPLWIKQC